MLILKRKPGESIRIADNIRILVVRIEGESVYLGIDAPREVAVNREEVWERIQGKEESDSGRDG